jgi:large subunit ribosomal protein L24e
MPQDRACDFCGDDIEPGTGTMFVRTDGTTIYYCSSKCEKNHDLGREARDLEWTGSEEPDEAGDEADDEPEEVEPPAESDTESGETEATDDAEEENGETEAEA